MSNRRKRSRPLARVFITAQEMKVLQEAVGALGYRLEEVTFDTTSSGRADRKVRFLLDGVVRPSTGQPDGLVVGDFPLRILHYLPEHRQVEWFREEIRGFVLGAQELDRKQMED